MEQQPIRTITLSESVISLLKEMEEQTKSVQDQMRPLQEKLNLLGEGVNKLISGICLQEGVNVKTERVNLAGDFTKIEVFDLNPEAKLEAVKKPSIKSYRKNKK